MTTPAIDFQGEDLRLAKVIEHEQAEAWLWWRDVPDLPGEKIGAIGHFSATGPRASVALLADAERHLVGQGCTLAVGPLDGNTWRKYRFVTERGTEPAFFLEPTNPETWPTWWTQAGYATLADYHSTLMEDLSLTDPRVAGAAQRLRASGITIRAISSERFVEDLTAIHRLSLAAFSKNFLYTPLTLKAFLAQYVPLRDRIVCDLVLIAERDSDTVGYVFATPDYAQASRSSTMDTVVVKTLAVLPGRSCAGLGAWLLAEVQRASAALGFKRAFHALMHESNNSGNLSSHYAQVIRRYKLFYRRLVP